MLLLNLFKDARYFQIIFQSIFLSYGIFVLHWRNESWLYLTYFATSLAMQFVCEYLLGKKHIPFFQRLKNGIPSVLISSFGLSLLLKTNNWRVAVLAAAVSILSKYIIRINGKHIFNPSALGIVAAVFLTGNAWISPGQWGSGAVILFGVLCFGFIVTTRVQKVDVSIAFLGTFAGLLFLRQIIYLGWPMDHFVQAVSTGSLLLFSFFMITDPKTIPNHTFVRILWCIAIAAVAFYLTAFKFMNGAPVIVLVLAQPLVPLLDKLFKARKFEWIKPKGFTPEEKNFLHVVYSRSSM
ncbi:MAG: RnfABCDGE type electron transport complex subunit D [Ferruginibacter sp.]|nr:RnfABCDGE type electron transport complex subunit D [Ferruginibacter sp.]